ncbi:MAG: ECF transporter S component [Lachnospiraceae bacterium]|nr:ECF transporter S component [Lachnospiraceae bacterium]
MKEKWLTTKNLVLMGMFGALAAVLMLFEFPLVFLAPSFYGLDLSEVPVLVGAFSMGPAAGVIIEFVKILIKLVMKPTTTGFVGEMANFVIGCSLVVPAAMIYHTKKSKKSAIYGMIVGTIVMALSSIVINAVVMLPFYSKVMPLESIIALGAAINPAVSNIWTFAIICVGPFNLVKGVVVSIVTQLVYKRISNLIHSVNRDQKSGGR